MADDILTRLRCLPVDCDGSCWNCMAADEIERLRAADDELHDDLTRLLREVGRLREQIDRAHNIIGSEAMIWLIVGANHPKAHLDAMRPAVNAYWEMYGNAFRGPKNEE